MDDRVDAKSYAETHSQRSNGTGHRQQALHPPSACGRSQQHLGLLGQVHEERNENSQELLTELQEFERKEKLAPVALNVEL